ncbi:hypothetical protein CBP36_21030 (plasmid) [Acidovorax carolinensis]|uniref:Methyltransferase n=1 Tax=Acidovorax carolinensis TaxID=553814 RepID=A0A240UIX4_9BURK|nr:site-specific DNA-methyltransferase [Acidovorax carolinensis]ART61454.1 hypothetical protein CBP36_21030 [Acidovorax carolinensis]
MQQLSLLTVLDSYKSGSQSNPEAYAQLGESCDIPVEAWEQRRSIGRAGKAHSPLKRKVRWYQQTLRRLGLLEPVAGRRGHWRATDEGRRTIEQREKDLEPAAPGVVQLGFSTELGMALWADCRDAFSRIEEFVHCVLTSPPYPLAHQRDYGGPAREEYVDWLCACLEPLVRRLAPGASVFLSISNDIFEDGSPARSLYRERLVIALHERLGLSKMDEWIWHNPSKAPGPIAWASKRRVQVNTSWEPIYWFTNDPQACFTDNRRVLRPHTASHTRFVSRGGAASAGVFGDGANQRRVGSFAALTAGAIPRNVLTVPHNCPSQAALRKWAKDEGIPLHSATMPLELAEHIVRFAMEPGMLLADPFGGWLTSAVAAERNGCRWIVTERMRAFLYAAQWRMLSAVDAA